jgi:hypothetical protein
MLWIRIRIILGTWIRIRIKVISGIRIRIRINLQMTSQNVWIRVYSFCGLQIWIKKTGLSLECRTSTKKVFISYFIDFLINPSESVLLKKI